MLVPDIPRRNPSRFSYIDVPLFHRVHLNLAAGHTLYGCLLASASTPHLPELVISPFEVERWDKIWRINMTVADRPGIFHEVSEVLTYNGGHVLAAESSTTQQQSLYQLELVIDLEDETRVPWIRLGLQGHFLKEMTFLPDGNPRFRMQRLHSLWHAKRDFEQQRAQPRGFLPQRIELQAKWAKKGPHQVLHLVMPDNIRTLLKNTVRTVFEKRIDNGFYLRLSDTKNRCLRVLYFRADEPVLHARIEYANRPGATTAITSALKEKDFNILTAYYAMSGNSGERSRLELVVRCNNLAGMRTAQKKAALEEALSHTAGGADLQIAIGYPPNYARVWERKGVKTCPKGRFKTEPAKTQWSESFYQKLAIQYTELKFKNDGLDNSQHVARVRLARNLVEKYHELVGKPDETQKMLFVSCHFVGNQREMIQQKAEAMGFAVITGNDLHDDNFRLGLLKAISSCTHFLGVWSKDGAEKFRQSYWPSACLLWEAGVADAFRLTSRLLISVDIHDAAWKRIFPERPHEFFTMDFETKLERVLKVLSTLPATCR